MSIHKKNQPSSSNVETKRHSLAHILAAAARHVFGNDITFGVGPTIENGFYYDIDVKNSKRKTQNAKLIQKNKTITEDDLPKIEQEMRRIINEHVDFVLRQISLKEAYTIFANDPYKTELLRDIERFGTTHFDSVKIQEPAEKAHASFQKLQWVTIYQTGTFIDLCRGPHVKNTRELQNSAFKLISVAGAYWRGSEKNPMLTRIYGVAFETKKELDDYLKQQEEIQKRDHRTVGAELEIFMFHDAVGKGLPLWLPRGTIIKEEIEYLAKEKENLYGYDRVSTPHLAKEELYLTSGHLPYYKDSMYPAMEMDDGIYYLKAMNCPHHHTIYGSKLRSYRDLPLRFAEYGTCYRNELSGTLAGLLRVRSLQMNDAHIYCRKDHIKPEIKNVIRLTQEYFKIFGFKDYWFRLSKWDPNHTEKYINEPKNWKFTEDLLRTLLTEMKVNFIEKEDEAAFYGPKIDVQFRSVIGREETMSTIQLDFLAKERFNLSYIDKDGAENHEVFVVHRAPLSVHERFIAFLIEHFAGAFPVWLAPVQIALVPVSSTHVRATKKLADALHKETQNIKRPLRIFVDASHDTVGYKIRRAAHQKIPYTIVIGDKEIPKKGVWSPKTKLTIRVFGKTKTKSATLEKFITDVASAIARRKLTL